MLPSASRSEPPLASRESARRFHFLREIASGGFGTVWLCRVTHPDGFSRLAAVKLLKQQWSESAEVVRRIRDEARLLGQLRHRSIITVYDLTSIEGRAAVVMEYVEGVDLRAVGKALLDQGQQMPVRAALELGTAIAGALDAAYNRPPLAGDKPLRVIHRDIKPSNVMVDGHGEVKVLDFGVARSDIDNRESHTEELQFGSVDYMAPERLFFEPETPAGDVYALGATLFEVLALEKLGKARGRPEQHRAAVEDRLSYLRARLSLRGTQATELMDLLRASLHHAHEQRPSAAELSQRCRALSRLIEDEELQPWAERIVPGLVEAATKARREPNPMADTVRLEDSVAPVTAERRPALEGVDLGSRVRQGALRELDDSSGHFRPEPTPVAPSYELDEDAADEWTDIPTNVGRFVDPTEPAEPLSEELRPVLRAASPVRPPPAAPPPAFAGPPPTAAPPPASPPPPPGPRLIAPATGAPQRAVPVALATPATIVPDEEVERTVVAPDPAGAERRPAPAAVAPAAVAPAAVPPAAVVPAAVVPAAVVPAKRPTAARPAGRGIAVLAGGLAGGCLLVVLAGGAVGLGALWWTRQGGELDSLSARFLPAEPDAPEPVEAAEAPPVEAAEAPPVELAEAPPVEPSEAPPAAAPGLEFESLDPGTQKLAVRCTGGEGRGATRASVPLDAAERCTVTAILEDRSRLVAVVDQVEAGAYGCFEGGEARCQRR